MLKISLLQHVCQWHPPGQPPLFTSLLHGKLEYHLHGALPRAVFLKLHEAAVGWARQPFVGSPPVSWPHTVFFAEEPQKPFVEIALHSAEVFVLWVPGGHEFVLYTCW